MDEEPTEVLTERLKEAGFESSFPQTQEEADAVDNLLASELSKLSVVEQDMVMFDLHGLATEIEETEELIRKSLDGMDENLQKIKQKPAFEKAMKLNPNYVCSRQFRLQFLRCESFEPKNAAKRLVLHFEKKQELFGGDGDVLGRDVRLSDLSQEDYFTLESGALQLLPTRDIGGRSVLAFIPGNWKRDEKLNYRSAQRVFYYMIATALREEETQKKGLVLVLYNVGPKSGILTLGLVKKLHSMRLSIPHKMLGMHFCFDDKTLRPMASGFRYFLDHRTRNRFRAHYGDEQKAMFQLQTFGIDIPFDENPFKLVEGGFNLSWHKEWLQIRKSQEEKMASIKSEEESSPVVVPHRFDVLFGRGKVSKKHTGNLRALHLVDMWQKKYDEAGKYEKTIISEKIVHIVRDSGGKFLRWEKDEGWIQVHEDAAREKVSHWFRHNRRKQPESDNEKSAEKKRKNI